MAKFLEILKLAFSLLPWIQEAEDTFGAGKGAEKKAFILHAVGVGGGALMQRFGVPASHVADFTDMVGEAIDMGVHILHVKGMFKAGAAKVADAHAAMAQAIPVAVAQAAAEEHVAAGNKVPAHVAAVVEAAAKTA